MKDYHSICKYGKDGIYETFSCNDKEFPTLQNDAGALEASFHKDKIPNDHLPARWKDF